MSLMNRYACLRSDLTVRKHVKDIMELHDQMADLKSYFDGHGAMSPECLVELGFP